MSDDRLIPESPALWWVETTDGVRSILRVVVDHNGSDTYLGFLAFEKLPRGDGSSWPVERFTGRWLAPVMLHEEAERLDAEAFLLRSALRDLVRWLMEKPSGSEVFLFESGGLRERCCALVDIDPATGCSLKSEADNG